MKFLWNRNLSRWSLQKIIVDIIIITKPFEWFRWFLLTTSLMALSTYLNVLFFSTITVNITRGLQILALLIVFENATAYCRLQQNLANKTFIYDFIKHFQTMLNERILSTNWIKIKLSDQVEIRRKIEQASTSVQTMIELFFCQLPRLLTFIMTIVTIFYLCPVATIVIAIAYVGSYRLYLSKKSNDLLALKLKYTDVHIKLNSKYSRANENMFEYVIHHEKKKIIDITNELRIEMEKKWSVINYLYDRLSFEENVVGHLCTFSTLLIYVASNGTNVFIIPLYHYLKTFTSSIDDILIFHIHYLRFIEDYVAIIPILEEYEERVNVEQVDLKNEIQIEDLSFKYKNARELFHLKLDGLLTFKVGQTILVKGKSGAGKIEDRLKHKIFFFQF